MIRRFLLCGLALMAAAFVAIAFLRTERVTRVDLGDERDARFVAGFHAPERAWRLTGRWTTGEGTVTVPRTGLFPTRVRVRLCTFPGRTEEQFRLTAGSLDVHTVRVPAGCQEVERPIRHHPHDSDVMVRLSSSPISTRRDPRSLGLYVDYVEVASDGPTLEFGRAAGVLVAVTLLAFGVLVGGWCTGVLAASALDARARLIVSMVFAVIAVIVTWYLLTLSVPIADALTRASVQAIVVAGLMAAVRAPRVNAWLAARSAPDGVRSPRVWVFAGATLVALALLFRETLLYGHVLSQANLLYQIFPWRTHIPDGYAPGNRLLGDIPLVFYPFLVHVQRALASWSLPLWSPHAFTGQPIFASFQSAALSPFTLLAVLTPLPLGTVTGAAARLVTGGVGMFLFTRRIGLSPAACHFCGLSYAINAFSYVWLEHPLSAVAAWLPWLLWAIERLAQHARARDAALFAATVALTVLAGHPETAFKVLMFAGVYGLVMTIGGPHRGRGLVWLAIASGLGVLLCAVQLLPFLEYLRESRVFAQRQTFAANPYFVSPDTLITTLAADFWGTPAADSYLARENSLGIPTNYCEQTIYAGALTWVLAAVGLCARGWDRRRVFFIGSLFAAAALMYHVPAAMAYVAALPIVRITVVSRLGLLVIICAIVLAGYGVDALTRRHEEEGADGSGHRFTIAAVTTAIALVVVLAWALRHYQPHLTAAGLFGRTAIGVAAAAALAIVTASLIVARVRAAIVAPTFGVAVCVLGVAHLLVFAEGFRMFLPPAQVAPLLPELAAVQADPGLFRVIGFGTSLPPNTAMTYALHDPRGYDGMSPVHLSELLDVGFVLEGSFHMTQHVDASRIINLLNVKYVVGRPGLDLSPPQFARVEAPGTPVFRNTDALPRAFLNDSMQVATGNVARRMLRDGAVDPRRTAVLEAPLPADRTPQPAVAGELGDVRVRHYRDMFVEIETKAAGQRLLVLTDLFYPGWVASIDGRETPIVRANFAFRAVTAPAGTHTVRFEYRPASVRTGAAISLTALLALAAMSVSRRRPSSNPVTQTDAPSYPAPRR